MSFKILTVPPRPFMSVPSHGDTAELKMIQPHKFHPLNIYLPHFACLNFVEDVKPPIPGRFPTRLLD